MLKFNLDVTIGVTKFQLTTYKRSIKHLEHYLRSVVNDNDDRKEAHRPSKRQIKASTPSYKIIDVVKCAA